MKKDITSILTNADVVLNQKTEQKLTAAIDSILSQFESELNSKSKLVLKNHLETMSREASNQRAEFKVASQTFQSTSSDALRQFEKRAQSVSEKSESAQQRFERIERGIAEMQDKVENTKIYQSRKMLLGMGLLGGAMLGAISTVVISSLLLNNQGKLSAALDAKLAEQHAQIRTLAGTYRLRPTTINGQPLLLLDRGLSLKRKSFVDRNNTTINAWEVIGK